MKCHLCGSGELFLIKKIKNGRIFECPKCKIAITSGKNFDNRAIREIYNFEQYKLSEPRFRTRIERLVEIITRFKKKGNLLDIGAGFGLFSSILSEKGKFKVIAVEPVLPLKYLNSKKVIYYKGKIEEFLKINKFKYDLILLIDVLEHFNSPYLNLKKLNTILNNGGYIVIQLPNYKSLMAKICNHWAWWMIEDHRFHFSPHSIRLLLKKTGYKIDFFTTYEDFYDFKKNLDGNFIWIKNSIVRKIMKLIFFTFFTPLYFIVRKIFWHFGYGGLIFLIASSEN